jgi:hypothetical protein
MKVRLPTVLYVILVSLNYNFFETFPTYPLDGADVSDKEELLGTDRHRLMCCPFSCLFTGPRIITIRLRVCWDARKDPRYV